MPLEPDDAQHLRAADGYLALGMHLEANAELEEIEPDVRHVPEVLVVRTEVYRAAQQWPAMQTIARRLAQSFRLLALDDEDLRPIWDSLG